MAVAVADDSTLKTFLQDNEKVIVKYFADWCGTCRLFSPKFRRLSEDERFSGIEFLDINAETSPEARKLGQVKNLPTFAIFRNGEMVDTVCTSNEQAVVELLEKLK